MTSPGTTGSTALGTSTGVHTHHNHLGDAQQVPGEAGEVSGSEATERQKPERDLATNLLGEEAADESSWRRG
jgi:hypothetical protein